MKKKLLLAVTILTLIMAGCAQKKLNTVDTNTQTTVPSGGDTNIYQNVDPIGQGNGVYGNGTYGSADAGYGDDLYGSNGLQKIYFGVDQYNITPDQLGKVAHNARLLKSAIASGAKVKIEGHCDATGSDEYNYALGLRRAKATKDALEVNGVNGNSITLVSMGESAPECTTSTSAECYAKNRRVEFKVIR